MRFFTVRGTTTETRPGGRPLIVPTELVVREDALWITPEGIRACGKDISVISIEDTTDTIITNPAFKRLLMVIESQRQWSFNMMHDEELFEKAAQSLIECYIAALSKPMSENERNALITAYHVKARELTLQ